MEKILRSAKFFLCLGFFCTFGMQTFYAQETQFPGLEPSNALAAVKYNGVNELSGEQVIRLGLVFSGVLPESESWNEYLDIYRGLEKEVVDFSGGQADQAIVGEKILTLMYERTLVQYVEHQTKLDEMFFEGTYNCVSASVLYMALAKAAGLTVIPQRTPDHCFCTVVARGNKIDVETTNPMGFNPGTRRVVSKKNNSTHYAVVPQKKYNGRHEVSDYMLVSLVSRNISALSMDRKDFTTAVMAAATRFVFTEPDADPKNDARYDFDTVVCNYAAELQRQKRHVDVLFWLDEVTERWGFSQRLHETYDSAVYNCVVYFCNAKDVGSAKDIYSKRKDRVQEKTCREIEQMIFQGEVECALETINDDEEALAYVKSAVENPLAVENRELKAHLINLWENIWLNRVDYYGKQGLYLEGAAVADHGLEELPQSRKLKQAKEQCLYNHAVDYHNKFASYANKRDYESAMAVLEQGLLENPDSKVLQSDMRSLKRILGQ